MIVLPMLVVALSSCEKAKQAVEAARAKISGTKDPGAPVTPGGEVSADLAAQVDTAAEGVRFRRDLKFPSKLNVRLVERHTFKNARVMSSSELGAETATIDGTWEMVGLVARDGGQVSLQIEKAGKVVDVEEVAKNAGGASNPPAASNVSPSAGSQPAGSKLTFIHTKKGWQGKRGAGPVDFRNMLWEKSLLPSLSRILSTNGLSPRTQWFSSSKRWIGGDEVVLSGDAIALLFPGKGNSGKVTLVYEAAEALDSHPCGRFSVKGAVSTKNEVGVDGVKRDSEVSITSGKIWCSLIYPVVMREEYESVVTTVEGSGSGPKVRIQGGVDSITSRSWKP